MERIEGGNRWETFLAADSRTAIEFRQAWSSLQLEAEQSCLYLGKEFEGEVGVESAGQDKTDGSTRRAVVQAREVLRHQVMTLALERHTDRTARPVTVFQNFDKLSGAWLLSLPGPDTGLSSSVFVETMAAHLCLPSPAVTAGGWVGRMTVRGGWPWPCD